MTSLNEFLTALDRIVWGPFLLLPLLLGTGAFLTFRLRGIQFRTLGRALRHAFLDKEEDEGNGDISKYEALTTALAATVGVGNIVGVATAMSIGGPGSLFWMWVTGLLGMASKYTEAFLGSLHRETDTNGKQAGGPQYYLRKTIKGPMGGYLATFFAVATAIAAFGIGNMTQSNAVAAGMQDSFGIPPWVSGAVMFLIVGIVLFFGIEAIGKVTSAFVPLMIVIYIVASTWVLVANIDQIPGAFALILTDAFTGTAATGGFAGAGIIMAMRMGVARGLFSNESGMGSGAIPAAAAKTLHPVRQGLVSMTQTFIDTLVVITFTGLVLIVTGVWNHGENAANLMTSEAFGNGLPGTFGDELVSISIIFFAFSTILGWSYYGERCMMSVFGPRSSMWYRLAFTIAVFIGAVTELTTVWTFSDLANGMMVLPNIVGILLVSGFVARETRAYLRFDPQLRASAADIEKFLERRGMDWT
ncbi:alanine/glycine:cation symporter family protein [Corynebacterium sp. TAE3-ERU16]|uniref:alanine/glycine:cation symporter family protein n=1 Tax=Corynebacterium sp. TAE3-ERU16 TaxID=2849493 RepID=UPI001C452075|nr:sodium:alanine symporter family protein [Corynebacterium sp. TAE3-ERU16]MBV7292458.1 sodium:alanine symporter family protein [Corynebacterium sp. TAE3-ERU16]